MKMSSLKITVAILILVFWTNTFMPWTRPVAAVNHNLTEAQTSVPSGWRKIDIEGKFSFYLPPDMRDTGRGSIENLHGEYTNGRMYLTFDYAANFYRSYENRFLNLGKDLEEVQLQVDGKKAFIFVFQTRDYKKRNTHIAEFWVGDLPNHEAIMSMSVSSRSPQAMETAKTIFRTLRLPSS